MPTSRLTQFAVLAWRNLIVAKRDPTQYVLQFVLVMLFGIMVGLFFYKLPLTLNARVQDVPNGVTWLVFVGVYIHVFGVIAQVRTKQRFELEHANGTYHTLPFWLADNAVIAVAVLPTYIPGLLAGFAIMELPKQAQADALLFLYGAAMCSVALIQLLTQFATTMSAAIVFSQAALVILSVFTGASFIRWSSVPIWWQWLSEATFFTQASKGLLSRVFEETEPYACTSALQVVDGACVVPGIGTFPCDASYNATLGECTSQGTTVLMVLKGLPPQNESEQAGVLYSIAALLMLARLFFMYFPPQVLWAKVVAGWYAAFSSSAVKVPTPHPATCAAGVHHHGHPPPALGPSLYWSDLTLRLPPPKKSVLVDGVCGQARPGRVLAVAGPSGAGKTTLLNALTARAPYAVVEGSVAYCGEPLSKGDLTLVPQFDSLLHSFTPRETLTQMQALQAPKDAAGADRVSSLLNILGLSSVADVRISKLSGGERKRVSIGVGLISQPRVLFLDEPSTGLDAAAAFSVIEHLVAVTRATGLIVVLTIHQPSAAMFEMLDDLLLLAKGGKTAYFGPAAMAAPHFSSLGYEMPPGTNPADEMLDLISAPPSRHPEGTTWLSLFTGSAADLAGRHHSDGSLASKSTHHVSPSELSRFVSLTITLLKYYTREPGMYLLRAVELLIIAVFIGSLFYNLPHETSWLPELMGAAFFSVWTILFAGIAATPVLCRDRLNTMDDVLNGAYRLPTFVGAQFLAGLPFHFLTALGFQAIVFYMCGFGGTGSGSADSFGYDVILTAALLAVMEGITLIVVEVLRDAMLATTFSMVTLGICSWLGVDGCPMGCLVASSASPSPPSHPPGSAAPVSSSRCKTRSGPSAGFRTLCRRATRSTGCSTHCSRPTRTPRGTPRRTTSCPAATSCSRWWGSRTITTSGPTWGLCGRLSSGSGSRSWASCFGACASTRRSRRGVGCGGRRQRWARWRWFRGWGWRWRGFPACSLLV